MHVGNSSQQECVVGPGVRVAGAPLSVPGVLAVHADIFGEREIVVGRRGVVSWEKVRASFAEAGCEAKRDD